VSIDSLTRDQEKFRNQMTQSFGILPFGSMEDQVRRNMEAFERAFSMFMPFVRKEGQAAEAERPAPGTGEIDDLKRQLSDVQKRLDRMGDKDK